MTARVIAAESDEYGEHVVRVSDTLARGVPTGGQSLLDRDDVGQIMSTKGWEDRAKVHGSECEWPDIPEGEPACCGLMCTALVNAAKSELRQEWGSRREVNTKVIPVDPAAFWGEGDWQPIHDEVSGTVGGHDPWGMACARVDLQRAMAELPPEQRDVVRLAAEEYTLQAAGEALGIPLQTVYYRLRAARRKLRLLVALAG